MATPHKAKDFTPHRMLVIVTLFGVTVFSALYPPTGVQLYTVIPINDLTVMSTPVHVEKHRLIAFVLSPFRAVQTLSELLTRNLSHEQAISYFDNHFGPVTLDGIGYKLS